MATRNLILWTLFSLSVSASSVERPLGKCCPPGEIFSGLPNGSNVVCAPASGLAMEVYRLDYGAGVHQHGFPRCEEPEDISTTPLGELKDDDFLQEPACLEILQTTEESVPIVVDCRSNKDRDERKRAPRTLPNPLHVRRCCRRNEFFDRRRKSCVSTNDTDHATDYSEINLFTSLLPKELTAVEFLMISRDTRNCFGAIFDYEVGAEDIVFENGTLKVFLPSSVDNTREKIVTTDENTCFELIPESPSKRNLLVRTCRSSEFCKGGSCLRKCCSEDEFYFFSMGCGKIAPNNPLLFHEAVLNIMREISPNFTDYGLLVGIPCQFGMYPLVPEDKWSVTSEGHLLVPDYDTYKHHQYCMDVLYNNSMYEEPFYPMVCFLDPQQEQSAMEARYKVTTTLEATSCFFLLLTLLVYSFLPVLQNLHGKTLMCHSASLLVAYGCLAIVPWVTPDTLYWDSPAEPTATIFCTSLGYVMFFSQLSAFFWLNVTCFDIWRTFGGLRGSTTRGQTHRKRFLSYCLYAWGVPMLMTIFSVLCDQTQFLPPYMKPNIGVTSCWFTQLPRLYGELIFFIGPVTIQLASNVVFFVLTSVHCSKVKAEIRRVADPSDPRSKRFHADKTKLIMNMKLFVVMGISWVAEIISSFLNKYTTNSTWQQELFYASDALNCLQGLLIFVLFVVKTRVYVALKRRLGFDQRKNVASQATTALHDPYRVKKSASSTTLTSNFAVSLSP